MLRGLFGLVAIVCIVFMVAMAAGFAAKAAVVLYPIFKFVSWLDSKPSVQNFFERLNNWDPSIPEFVVVFVIVMVVVGGIA